MKIAHFFTIMITSLLLCFCLTLWYFFPIFSIPPKPEGAFSVGVFHTSITDEQREERHSHDPAKKRSLALSVYYPCKKAHIPPHQPDYLQEIFWRELRSFLHDQSKIPLFLLNHFCSTMPVHAILNAPCSVEKESYPVVIFSHGIAGLNLYTTYLEDLASHGYIVIAVTHTYDALITVFPDGKVVSLGPTLQSMIDLHDRTAIHEYRHKAHFLWLEDLRFVMDQLGHINQDTSKPMHQKLDIDRIGVLGHSHGGSVALALCDLDNRCKAGIDMDGWTKSVDLKACNKPFMFLLNEEGIEAVDLLFPGMGSDAYKIIIPGAGHDAFSDKVLLKWPLTRLFGIASQDANTVRKKILEHVCSFFDQYLKKRKSQS